MAWHSVGARIAGVSRSLMRAVSTPAPTRPIVILQSDDWGRVGISGPEQLDCLKQKGHPAPPSPWNLYGLETRTDLERLATCLARHRDADGRAAGMVANFILANPDLPATRQAGAAALVTVPIDEGFPPPWTDQHCATYRDLVASQMFYPGLHGYTHFHGPALLRGLHAAGDFGERVRAMAACGVPYLASLAPEFNFALVTRHGGREEPAPADWQADWMRRGVEIFRRVFGSAPVTACAPGYRHDAVTRALWHAAGVRVVQIFGSRLATVEQELLILSRNVHFEPGLDPAKGAEHALSSADRAIASGVPVIVCTHSINYIERFLGRNEHALVELDRFLGGLRRRHPDLRFSDDATFAEAWLARSETWFRRPDAREIANRVRYFHGP